MTNDNTAGKQAPWAQLYNKLPVVDKTAVEMFMSVVLGPADSPPADRVSLGVAHALKGQWAVHLYDCRRDSRHGKNLSLAKKLLQGVGPCAPRTCRLFYSNIEFSTSRGLHTLASEKNADLLKGKGGKLVRRALQSARSLPDPLESVTLAMSKKEVHLGTP